MTWPKKEIYPIWYFNKKPNSDKDFILKRMAVIPKEHKRKIADRYEIIYQKPSTVGNRKRANTFLNKIAKWFHNEPQRSSARRKNVGI
jgi:hypothetical protein